MANTIKTLTAGDITRKALSILHNKATFLKTINRQFDSRFAKTGGKNGGYLEIREPNEFSVRTGAVMDTQDVTETTTQLVLATQKGVDINFSSAELTLSMDDFADRILEPAMTRLAADVEATMIADLYPRVWNFENTTFGTKPVLADVLAARSLLSKGLAPRSDRHMLVDSLAANAIITDGKALFHPASEIQQQYSEGMLGRIGGFTMHESEMTPTHTTGTRTTAGTCDLSAVANGDTTLDTAHTNTETFTKGDVLTVAGVYAVNQETKVPYAHLQQFTITTAITCDTTDTLAVTPTIYKSGPRQNVYSADWTDATAATVVDLAGSSGTASTAYVNSMAYHRDAFAAVFADLEMPQGVDFAARKVIDGVSLRVVRDFDIVNDKFPCRIDVLFGQKLLRGLWAARICS